MRRLSVIFLLALGANMMAGWGVFAEFSHNMSAVGRDTILRLGGETPSLFGFSLTVYGEYNFFSGIPINTTGGTILMPYSAVGGDVMYIERRLEYFQPYGRFGMFMVWPNGMMTSLQQDVGLKAGVGMRFLPEGIIGFSAGIDFLGLFGGGRAERVTLKPVYHHGIHINGGIFVHF